MRIRALVQCFVIITAFLFSTEAFAKKDLLGGPDLEEVTSVVEKEIVETVYETVNEGEKIEHLKESTTQIEEEKTLKRPKIKENLSKEIEILNKQVTNIEEEITEKVEATKEVTRDTLDKVRDILVHQKQWMKREVIDIHLKEWLKLDQNITVSLEDTLDDKQGARGHKNVLLISEKEMNHVNKILTSERNEQEEEVTSKKVVENRDNSEEKPLREPLPKQAVVPSSSLVSQKYQNGKKDPHSHGFMVDVVFHSYEEIVIIQPSYYMEGAFLFDQCANAPPFIPPREVSFI